MEKTGCMVNRLASSNTILSVTNLASYSANSLNQYSAISNIESQITLPYDQNGNRTNKVTATETNAYTWDIENRLVGFQKTATNGVTTASYAYDPFGRRLMKSVSSPSHPSYTNYYLYADEGLIGEYDAAGNEIKSYGYKPNSLWMNDPVFLRESESATNYYYFINDHLGSPQKLVAKNGTVVWSMIQDAFGRAVVSSNSTIICNLRFSSQYYDPEFGLDYNTMRYYDPVSGRYISRDPIGENGGINLFAFVNNLPVSSYDLLGLWKPSWCKIECPGEGFRNNFKVKRFVIGPISPNNQAALNAATILSEVAGTIPTGMSPSDLAEWLIGQGFPSGDILSMYARIMLSGLPWNLYVVFEVDICKESSCCIFWKQHHYKKHSGVHRCTKGGTIDNGLWGQRTRIESVPTITLRECEEEAFIDVISGGGNVWPQ